MNRYIFIHRIKWPVMLVIFGVTALLDQWNILAFDQKLAVVPDCVWGSATGGTRGLVGSTNPMPGPYAGEVPPQGNWGGPPAAPPPSTSMTITPPTPPDKERT